MSYALSVAEPVADGLRRIAREQADQALDSLGAARRDHEAADEAIHDARKRFKKIRAVLRLVRTELGEEAWERENAAWRDAGRLLAPARAGAVIPDTVARLREHSPGVVAADACEAMVASLREAHARAAGAAREPGGAVEQAEAAAAAARDRIDAWPLAEGGFELIAPALRTAYRRGRKRMAEAYGDPTGPRFHAWRKRAAELWYHLRILTPTWTEVLKPWAAAQHDLTSRLGEGNDLADLLARLQDGTPPAGDAETAAALGPVAERRRLELWESARPLGARLYAESPGDFEKRMERYWQAARSG